MSELREFLMLAHPANFGKHTIGGWFMSEKLDGMRCFWDGGVTTGIACRDIPFANVEKHDRYTEERISTGLWTRYGQPIYAPLWWLNKLPKMMLDGELYSGRGQFQFVTSTVKDLVPNDLAWQRINFCVFDTPPVRMVFQTGKINNTNFKKQLNGVHDWFEKLPGYCGVKNLPYYTPFKSCYYVLNKLELPEGSPVIIHNQIQLPLAHDKAVKEVEAWLEAITTANGEGLMLRKDTSYWEPKRSHNLIKVKKMLDTEGEVIGYVSGERTELGSKLLGMLGSLVVRWNGKVFNLSGFTDAERELNNQQAFDWACDNPGKELPVLYHAKHFPRGCKVTFKYRELTNDGFPKEARYFRKA